MLALREAGGDTGTPTPLDEPLMAAARTLLAALRRRAPDDERACRLDAETVAEFRANGFFSLLQPRAFGGQEASPRTLLRLQAVLGEADMSASWVLGNMGIVAFHLALFAPQAQADVWGEAPEAILASSNMPGGRGRRLQDGSFELSGQWRFSSGVDHADWVVLGALCEAEDPGAAPIPSAVLLPRRDIVIAPDWDVVGLRGTGSHGIRVDTVRVPGHRVLPHRERFLGRCPGHAVNTGPLYRIPVPQLQFRTISTASIGGLAGMLADFLAANGARTSMLSQKIAEDPHVQSLCATIDADLAAMRAVLETDIGTLEADAALARDTPLAARRSFRLNATRVADRCFSHAAGLYRAAGAEALYRGSPLLRVFNDLLAARQHAANQYEVHARIDGAALFGAEREDMLL